MGYGLIYHAQLVGQASSKLKGKVSRMLAAKAAIATRVDALGEETNTDLGIEHRAKVESRIRQLEGGEITKIHIRAPTSQFVDPRTGDWKGKDIVLTLQSGHFTFL